MTGRRLMDESAHAHKRESDPDDFARLHNRACDDPDRRFEWHIPAPTPETKPATEGPCAKCAWAGALGALAGGLVGALLVLAALVSWS